MATYIINKNEHYSSGNRLNILTFKKELTFSVYFHNNCFYSPTLLPANDRLDINKLYGIGDMFSNKSARVGFRAASSDLIQLVTYCHLNGEFVPNSEHHLVYVEKGETVKLGIKMTSQGYEFYSKDNQSEGTLLQPFDKAISSINRRFYAYHGGNNPSPQQMTIEINEL